MKPARPGNPNCSLISQDKINPTIPVKTAVKKYCTPITLASWQKTHLVMKVCP